MKEYFKQKTKSPYKQLSNDVVEELHQNFVDKIKDRVEKSVSEDSANRRQIVNFAANLLFSVTRIGGGISDAELKEHISNGVHTLKKQTSSHRSIEQHDMWMSHRNDIDKAYENRQEAQLAKKVFGDKDRIYLEINEGEVSETQKKVAELFQRLDFDITDYKNGYATDKLGKQTYKIGKLLKDHKILLEKFRVDDTRTSEGMMVVISKKQKDLELMSTRRGWESCMASDGMFKEKVPSIIGSSTLVAYLIKKSDPEINDPLARILLKSFCSKSKSSVWRSAKEDVSTFGVFGADVSSVFIHAASKVLGIDRRAQKKINNIKEKDYATVFVPDNTYGLRSDSFRDVVKAFASAELNRPIDLDYQIEEGIYQDGTGSTVKVNKGEVDYPHVY